MCPQSLTMFFYPSTHHPQTFEPQKCTESTPSTGSPMADSPRNRTHRFAASPMMNQDAHIQYGYPSGQPSANVNVEAVRMLQDQFAQLQMQYKEQNAFIQKLVVAHKALVVENQRLKLARSKIPSKASTPSSHSATMSTTMNTGMTTLSNNSSFDSSHSSPWSNGQTGHIPPSYKPHYVQPGPTPTAPTTGQLDQYSCGDIVDSIIREDYSVDAELFKTTNAMMQDPRFAYPQAQPLHQEYSMGFQ